MNGARAFLFSIWMRKHKCLSYILMYTYTFKSNISFGQFNSFNLNISWKWPRYLGFILREPDFLLFDVTCGSFYPPFSHLSFPLFTCPRKIEFPFTSNSAKLYFCANRWIWTTDECRAIEPNWKKSLHWLNSLLHRSCEDL